MTSTPSSVPVNAQGWWQGRRVLGRPNVPASRDSSHVPARRRLHRPALICRDSTRMNVSACGPQNIFRAKKSCKASTPARRQRLLRHRGSWCPRMVRMSPHQHLQWLSHRCVSVGRAARPPSLCRWPSATGCCMSCPHGRPRVSLQRMTAPIARVLRCPHASRAESVEQLRGDS